MLRVDLHIHSCLSPCANDDMTPYNITKMAAIKHLQAIAICDHNSAGNVLSCVKAGTENGVCVVPALEVTSKEEIHVLCYFTDIESAVRFGQEIEKRQPNIKNDTSVFGNQWLMDEKDNLLGSVERWLLAACELSIDEIYALTRVYGGMMVPAHINKGANSLLTILGMFPQTFALPTVEQFRLKPYPQTGKLNLFSSDAHTLSDILEDAFMLDCDEISVKAIVQALKDGKPNCAH